MTPAWKRNQHVMVATVFAVFTGFAFVLPFIPLYVRQLGVQDPQEVALWAGLIIGVAPLLAGLLAPVWGRLADRHGQKPMAVRALVSYVILLALSAAATSVGQLFLLRAGVGLFGGVGPLGLAMATARAPREHTGRAVGAIQAAQILAAAVGPLAGGLMADTFGMRSTFLATSVLCAISLWLVIRYYEDGPPAEGAGPARSGSFGEVLRLTGVAPLLLVLFLVNFVGRSFTPVLPLHLHELGIPNSRLAASTGLLISAYSVAAALSAALFGRATRRRSPRLLLVLSLAGGAVAVAPMATVGGFSGFMVLALALGLLSGGALTLCYTLGGLMVPAERRTTAFGFFSGAALFGGAIAPTVAGALARWGLRGIYYVDGAIFLCLALGLLASLGAVPDPARDARSSTSGPAGVSGPEQV